MQEVSVEHQFRMTVGHGQRLSCHTLTVFQQYVAQIIVSWIVFSDDAIRICHLTGGNIGKSDRKTKRRPAGHEGRQDDGYMSVKCLKAQASASAAGSSTSSKSVTPLAARMLYH